jgi:hypothetical protein
VADRAHQGDTASTPVSPWLIRHRGVLAALVMSGGFAVLAATTMRFPSQSRGFPLFVLTAAAVLFALVAVQDTLLEGTASPAQRPTGPPPRVVAFVVLWLLYPAAMMTVGFLVSTMAALAGSLAVLHVRRLLMWALGAVPVTVLVFAVLQVVLNIALPQTPLDRLVASFLYRLGG